MNERRKHPRVTDDLGIAVSVVDDTTSTSQRAGRILHLTTDISRRGLQLRHDRELPLDALLRIHVALKFPLKTITHLGRVRWARPTGVSQRCSIGVEFTDTPPVDMLHWAHYIDHKLLASPLA